MLIWIVTAVIFRPDSRDASPRGDSRSRRYWLRLLLAAFFVVALRAHHPGGESFDAALGWLRGRSLCDRDRDRQLGTGMPGTQLGDADDRSRQADAGSQRPLPGRAPSDLQRAA